ncbi:MAG: hypothetical protein MRY60_08955 [Algiphilus sp.]|uniref:restriction endonuclease subunit S n=1 Tax=Algiphilus sp. TaxID=1872431 RepID=UPI0025C01C6E|nr:hypothetical protein [Algiphilus sp.]MCI5103892.1 hypothetical protein [Algiphilus sp.]
MSHYKPYPAYKDSGVEWIGRVPEHWQTLRIKRAAQLRNERRNDAPKGWNYVGLEDVEPESGSYTPSESSSRQSDDSMVGVFHAGDVLYSKLRPYLRKAIVANQDGVCSTEFLVLTAGRAQAPWLHRWLLTPDVTQQIEAGCEGTKMPRADWEHIGSIPMPLPPPAEQSAIAAALDRESARIDALIAKKTRFIELLKEKRQALITYAVTKGLDPNVKMKDSGVEWVGEVPEHWEIRRIGTLYREAARDGEIGLPVLSISIHDGITDEELGKEDRARRVDLIEDRTKYQKVVPGDLAYNMMRAWQGGFGAVQVEGLVSPAYVVAEPIKELSSDYIEKLLRTSMAIEEMRRFSRGIADFRQRLYWEHFRDLHVCFPPPAEQRGIIDYIQRQTGRIRRIESYTLRSIELLRERRSALITAAVTGQIDLRGAARS